MSAPVPHHHFWVASSGGFGLVGTDDDGIVVAPCRWLEWMRGRPINECIITMRKRHSVRWWPVRRAA